MLIRFKQHGKDTAYYAERTIPSPRDPPPPLHGPLDRCTGCPYPGHGFICGSEEKCIRTEVARIMKRDKGAL